MTMKAATPRVYSTACSRSPLSRIALHHRHVVTDDVVEIERGLGLLGEGGGMADVDRLVQVDKLAVLPQAVEELAEVFLHKASLPLIWPGKLMSPARKRNQAAGSSDQEPAALGANIAGNGRAAWPNFFYSSVDGRSISHQNTVASASVAAICTSSSRVGGHSAMRLNSSSTLKPMAPCSR